MCSPFRGKNIILLYSFTDYVNYGSPTLPVHVSLVSLMWSKKCYPTTAEVHLIHEVMNFSLFRGCIYFQFASHSLEPFMFTAGLSFVFPLVSGLSILLPVLIQVFMSLKINNTKAVPCQSRADQWPRSRMFQLNGAQVILTSTLQCSASKGATLLPGILTSGNSLLITLSAVPALNFLLRPEYSFSSG